MWMDWLTLIIILINPILGSFILLAGKKGKVPILIISLTFLLSAWTAANYFYGKDLSYETSLLFNRLVFTFTAPLISILGHLAIIFPKEKKLTRRQFMLIYVPALIFTPISLTNLIVRDIEIRDGAVYPVFNIYAALFGLSSVIIILFSLGSFIQNYTRTSGLEKVQMKFFAFGLSLTAIFAVITNLILPMGFGIFNYTNLGPSSSIIFILFTVFAIIRYQLFNIRFLIGKIFYYILVAIPPYFTYFLLAYIYESIFGTSFNIVAYIAGIPIAIAFTGFLNFFTKLISEYTDTHFINPGYNPLVVLEQHRQRLSNTLDIEKIIQESLFIVARTIRPSNSGVILMGKKSEDDWFSVNYKKNPYENPKEFKIFTEYFLRRQEKAISYDNLIRTEIDEDTVLMQTKHLSTQMEKHNLGVIVVIKEEATIKGILLVGSKEANEPYNSQEIKFLVSIADSMSLALGRALLYKETQQFNEELKLKVNEATATLQKKNKALEEALAQLEEIRRQEKDMLDVMGHELRTPVSIARNALLTLRKHLKVKGDNLDPERVKRYTNMAVEGTRREIALVETLLSTTKLEGNRMQVNLIPMSLVKVIEYSLRSHNDLAEKNKTELVYNKPEKDITVLADKIRIQEIMDNFLNNAIKYTGQGKVEIAMYERDGLGWIDVKDSGIGISEENLQHLGKKFFRAQNLYNKSKNVVNPSGTGLGLFVSFLLIDMMKGKRQIVSKEGEGSTFSFGLPVYTGPKIEQDDEPIEESEEPEENGEADVETDAGKEESEQNGDAVEKTEKLEQGENLGEVSQESEFIEKSEEPKQADASIGHAVQPEGEG